MPVYQCNQCSDVRYADSKMTSTKCVICKVGGLYHMTTLQDVWTGPRVYELSRPIKGGFPQNLGTHYTIFMNKLGIFDNLGRQVSVKIDFQPSGLSVLPNHNITYADFAKGMNVVKHFSVTRREAMAIIAEMISATKTLSYTFIPNDCGETIDYVESALQLYRKAFPKVNRPVLKGANGKFLHTRDHLQHVTDNDNINTILGHGTFKMCVILPLATWGTHKMGSTY